jgi:hypothetical protein
MHYVNRLIFTMQAPKMFNQASKDSNETFRRDHRMRAAVSFVTCSHFHQCKEH